MKYWVNYQKSHRKNLEAIKGDDFPHSPWFQGSGEQWGRDQIYPDTDIIYVYPIDQVTYPIFQWIPLI